MDAIFVGLYIGSVLLIPRLFDITVSEYIRLVNALAGHSFALAIPGPEYWKPCNKKPRKRIPGVYVTTLCGPRGEAVAISILGLEGAAPDEPVSRYMDKLQILTCFLETEMCTIASLST